MSRVTELKWNVAAMLIACAFLFAGCASTSAKRAAQQAEATEAKYAQLMRDAENALKNDKKDQALGMFANAANINPTRKEPWQRIAQVQFESDNYVEAAVAAQEVLQRDASGNESISAQSILAVSGLRLSVRALSELRGKDFLRGDVRRAAEILAQDLRLTLNEPVLVPQTLVDSTSNAATEQPAPAQPVRSKTKSAKTKTAVVTNKPAPTQADAGSGAQKSSAPVSTVKNSIPDGAVSGDPFGALK